MGGAGRVRRRERGEGESEGLEQGRGWVRCGWWVGEGDVGGWARTKEGSKQGTDPTQESVVRPAGVCGLCFKVCVCIYLFDTHTLINLSID